MSIEQDIWCEACQRWHEPAACPRWERTWTMCELDELCAGFGSVTSPSAEATINDFLEYITSKQVEQEMFEHELDREFIL